MANIIQKLCGLLTRHHFRASSIPFERETGRTEYCCICKLCGCVFWTDEKPKGGAADGG